MLRREPLPPCLLGSCHYLRADADRSGRLDRSEVYDLVSSVARAAPHIRPTRDAAQCGAPRAAPVGPEQQLDRAQSAALLRCVFAAEVALLAQQVVEAAQGARSRLFLTPLLATRPGKERPRAAEWTEQNGHSSVTAHGYERSCEACTANTVRHADDALRPPKGCFR